MSDGENAIALATELTVAWLANPNTRASGDDIPAFLSSVHAAIGKLSRGADAPAQEQAPQEYTPAVSVRKSLARSDRIISMIDGKPYASLKRHLRTHGLTPDQYRERYGLRSDYPMVASAYSEARSAAAKSHGFGRKSREAAAEPAASAAGRRKQDPSPPAETKAKAATRKRLGIAGAKAAAKQHLGASEQTSTDAEA